MHTIQLVARYAGVEAIDISGDTVNSTYTSGETRERVKKFIAELGYVPNTPTTSLRSKS